MKYCQKKKKDLMGFGFQPRVDLNDCNAAVIKHRHYDTMFSYIIIS